MKDWIWRRIKEWEEELLADRYGPEAWSGDVWKREKEEHWNGGKTREGWWMMSLLMASTLSLSLPYMENQNPSPELIQYWTMRERERRRGRQGLRWRRRRRRRRWVGDIWSSFFYRVVTWWRLSSVVVLVGLPSIWTESTADPFDFSPPLTPRYHSSLSLSFIFFSFGQFYFLYFPITPTNNSNIRRKMITMFIN